MPGIFRRDPVREALRKAAASMPEPDRETLARVKKRIVARLEKASRPPAAEQMDRIIRTAGPRRNVYGMCTGAASGN